MSKKPTAKAERPNPHGYKHKMVNGELVELTDEEINELLDRDEAAAAEQEQTNERGGSERR